jgi:hypothetical protein
MGSPPGKRTFLSEGKFLERGVNAVPHHLVEVPAAGLKAAGLRSSLYGRVSFRAAYRDEPPEPEELPGPEPPVVEPVVPVVPELDPPNVEPVVSEPDPPSVEPVVPTPEPDPPSVELVPLVPPVVDPDPLMEDPDPPEPPEEPLDPWA